MMENFPKRLQSLREKRGLSRRTVAELCGISKSALCRFERGERVPDLETAAVLADFFFVSLDYLAGKE